ncbi:P-loop NTPase fold protein [Kribbella sp. NPDC026611]|uniref:P-loop NTPase fold protein n=1 Tax=Kribbella sp. NPDC026611 TaxID=3154911 RepID=UPI003410A7C4
MLATDGRIGSVRLWDPWRFVERGAIETDGVDVSWGAWGQVRGEAVLATGIEEQVQIWPATIIRDPGAASSKGVTPVRVDAPRTIWGSWGELDGDPVLATLSESGVLQFYNAPTGRIFSVSHEGFSGPPIGATWGTRPDGRSALVLGSETGDFWICDPRAGTITRFGGGMDPTLRWGAWGQLDERPVLAAGDLDGGIWLWDLVWERPVPRVPRYQSDRGARDLLGRRADATALADVITARSAQPPLAVGVFGQWGDGKTQFLEMVQDEVQQRSTAAGADDPIVHRHVRQVRFNAWHYAETDLWASLVAELFAQLQEDSRSDLWHEPGVRQRQQSRLASELVQARGLREQLAVAEKRLDDLRNASATKWASLSPSERRQLRTRLGDDAEKLYEQATAVPVSVRLGWRSLKELASALPRPTWLWVIAIALLGIAAAIWGPGLIHWLSTLPFIAALIVLVQSARPAWKRLRSGQEALSSLWQKVRDVQEEQRHRLETAEAVAAAEVDELRNRLRGLTSAGQLAGLVQDRASSKTYREHLGLMTEIRQDFERMAELLQQDPTRRDVPERDAAGDELPAIDRIVIYIDDLDRCPPDRVVEVLEAIHLLLAVRLFVVVVAVDPRWLLRSLTAHYRELFSPPDVREWASTPAQYLEKIFQIVLTLPPMEQSGYRQMIDDLVGLRATEQTTPPPATTQPAQTPSTPASSTLSQPDESVAAPLHLGSTVIDRVDPLALTEDELTLINLLGPPLVSGPRSVKRLANSYGLLVATQLEANGRTDLDPVPDLDGQDTYPYRAAMTLLATVIAFPMLGPDFFPDLHLISRAQPSMSWNAYRDRLRGSDGKWYALVRALDTVTDRCAAANLRLPEDLRIWTPWIVPVGRLSFPTGTAVSQLH